MKRNVYSKLVGVTFNEKQDTLKQLRLQNPWRFVCLIHTTYDNPETGETEPAIQVVDKITKQQIGWIARVDLHRYEGRLEMVGLFDNYRKTEYCHLYIPKQPTAYQYKVVKSYCDRHGLKMPIYDVNAYNVLFQHMRSDDR